MRVTRLSSNSKWGAGGGLIGVLGVLYSVVTYQTDGMFWVAWQDPYIWPMLLKMAVAAGFTGGATAAARDLPAPWQGGVTPEPVREPTQPHSPAQDVTQPNTAQEARNRLERVQGEGGALIPDVAVVAAPEIALEAPVYDPVRVMQSVYFEQHELECSGMECNCQFIGMSKFTMDVADAVREKFGKIKSNSAYRCVAHNSTIKNASKNSWHTKGGAIDMKPLEKGVTPKMIYDFLNEKFPNQFGLGLYSKFVHFDDRPAPYYGRKESANSAWYQRKILDLALA